MGKRYYCDFCEKLFADNATSRKNHLNGVQHKQNKKLHYDSFRDAATILAEENLKRPCRKFMQSGFCEFGDSCRYSHMTPSRRQELQEQIMLDEARKNQSSQESPTLEGWLAKRSRKTDISEGQEMAAPSSVSQAPVLPMYHLPDSLASYCNLPPSVLPPPPDALVGLEPTEWG